jgi:hypothetical protein
LSWNGNLIKCDDFFFNIEKKFKPLFSGNTFTVKFKLGVKMRGRVKDTSYRLISTPYNRTRHVKCSDEVRNTAN